jgi:hypothetical protein
MVLTSINNVDAYYTSFFKSFIKVDK